MVKKTLALAFGLAAFFAAGTACAEGKNTTPTAPWYERFTFGSEFNSGVNAWTPRGESKANIKVSPKSRWGVSFGVQPSKQSPVDNRNGQTSAGAFYDINKNLRVGGGVVIPDENINQDKKDKNKRSPSIKIESAFRF